MRAGELLDRAAVPLAAMIALAITCVPCAAQQRAETNRQRAGTIRKIKKVEPQTASDSVADVTNMVHVVRLRDRQLLDSLPASKKMDLFARDVLTLPTLWRTHLKLEFDGDNNGRVTLAPEILTKTGEETVFGARPGSKGGQYSVRRDADRVWVDIQSGAVIIKDWRANRAGTVCVRAGAANVCNEETTYAVNQDSAGVVGLFVEKGDVQITRDDGTTKTAHPGEVYRWSATLPIELVPMSPQTATILQEAVDFTGDDLWHGFREELLLIPVAAAVVVCLVTDIWFCGGDGDATGNVIISPVMGPRR